MTNAPSSSPPSPQPGVASRSTRSGRRRGNGGRRFLVVGDVLDGVIVHTTVEGPGASDPSATIRSRASGAAANTAAWLGWLGSEVDFVGCVGVDDVYRHGSALADAGVTPHLRYDRSTATGVVVAVHATRGEVAMTDSGASGRLDLASVGPDLVAAADVVHLAGDGLFLGSDIEQIGDTIRGAAEAGARVSVRPPSPRGIESIGAPDLLTELEDVDVLLPTGAEATALTGHESPVEAARALSERIPLVVVTLAGSGADQGTAAIVARTGRTPQEVTADDTVGVVAGVGDPLGAVDAFAAGFLSAWSTDPVRSGAAARAGARIAARSHGVVGARPV